MQILARILFSIFVLPFILLYYVIIQSLLFLLQIIITPIIMLIDISINGYLDVDSNSADIFLFPTIELIGFLKRVYNL